jgi:hypothetical protein
MLVRNARHHLQKEQYMKVALLTGALFGIFYQNSATAKDQDGIVIFGGGTLGCAKYSSVQTKNNALHVKCSVGDNIILDFNRQIVTKCSGFIEGDWKLIEGQALFKNISINNEHFTCYRTSYKPAFDLDKIATYDVSLHSYSQSPTPMLLTYDVLSTTVQVCFAPYLEMEMACAQEKTPPSK